MGKVKEIAKRYFPEFEKEIEEYILFPVKRDFADIIESMIGGANVLHAIGEKLSENYSEVFVMGNLRGSFPVNYFLRKIKEEKGGKFKILDDIYKYPSVFIGSKRVILPLSLLFDSNLLEKIEKAAENGAFLFYDMGWETYSASIWKGAGSSMPFFQFLYSLPEFAKFIKTHEKKEFRDSLEEIFARVEDYRPFEEAYKRRKMEVEKIAFGRYEVFSLRGLKYGTRDPDPPDLSGDFEIRKDPVGYTLRLPVEKDSIMVLVDAKMWGTPTVNPFDDVPALQPPHYSFYELHSSASTIEELLEIYGRALKNWKTVSAFLEEVFYAAMDEAKSVSYFKVAPLI